MKLVTNLIFAVHLSGIAEGLTLGKKAGLDPEAIRVINNPQLQSWGEANEKESVEEALDAEGRGGPAIEAGALPGQFPAVSVVSAVAARAERGREGLAGLIHGPGSGADPVPDAAVAPLHSC